MEIFHLRYFVAVAEELNFSRAARRLNVSPSPLSQRIKDLERSLGTALFERSPQYVRLTPAGSALLPQARDLLERFDSLADSFGITHSTENARPFRLGVAPDVTPAIRQRVAGTVRSLGGSIRVKSHPASTAQLMAGVRRGELDAALVHGARTSTGVSARLLDRQPIGVAISSELPAAASGSVRLEDLRPLAWATINHAAAPMVYRRTDAVLTAAGVLRRVILDSSNVGDLLHLVLDGDAFALVGLQEGATRKAFTGEPVSILPILGHRFSLPTHLVWRPSECVAGSLLERTIAMFD